MHDSEVRRAPTILNTSIHLGSTFATDKDGRVRCCVASMRPQPQSKGGKKKEGPGPGQRTRFSVALPLLGWTSRAPTRTRVAPVARHGRGIGGVSCLTRKAWALLVAHRRIPILRPMRSSFFTPGVLALRPHYGDAKGGKSPSDGRRPLKLTFNGWCIPRYVAADLS